MPNTTTINQRRKIDSPSLGNIGRIDFSSKSHKSKYDLARILQNILVPIATDKKNPIAKSITKCNKYVVLDNIYGNVGATISLSMNTNGTVSVSGTIKCKNRDCPICSDKAKIDTIEQISKSVQEGLLQDWDMFLFTGTKSPELDQNLSKRQIQKARSKMRACVNNYNQRHQTTISFTHTRENTFSSKKMHTHHKEGRLEHAVRYTHDHTHGIIGISPEDIAHKDSILSLLKKSYLNAIRDCDGKVFSSNIGFRLDQIEGEQGLAKYLAKSMSLEITQGNKKGGKKTGSGYGLSVLLDKLPDMEYNDRIEYEELIRQHFISKYRKSETKSNKVVEMLAYQFTMRREKAIHDYCNKNYEDNIDRGIAIIGFMSEGQHENLNWSPSSLQPEEKEMEQIKARLEVDCDLWDYVSHKGYGQLITHLFTEYHSRGLYVSLYWELITLLSDGELIRECRRTMSHIREKRKKPNDCAIIVLDDWLERCYSSGSIPEWFWGNR